jgi:hypothetical protein
MINFSIFDLRHSSLEDFGKTSLSFADLRTVQFARLLFGLTKMQLLQKNAEYLKKLQNSYLNRSSSYLKKLTFSFFPIK